MAKQIIPATLREVMARPDFPRWALTAAAVVALVGGLTAAGLLGGEPISRHGDLTETSSLLAPAAPALRIWVVLGVLFALYVAWQWLPVAPDQARAQASCYPATGALFLAGLWFVMALAGGVFLCALLSVGLVVCLAWGLARMRSLPSTFGVRHLTQAPFAVGLGWAMIVCLSSIGSLLATWGSRAFWMSADVWAMLAVIGLLGTGMALIRYLPGRLYTALGLAWGLLWLGYARLLRSPRSIPVALVAGLASGLIVISAVAVFLWVRTRARHG